MSLTLLPYCYLAAVGLALPLYGPADYEDDYGADYGPPVPEYGLVRLAPAVEPPAARPEEMFDYLLGQIERQPAVAAPVAPPAATRPGGQKEFPLYRPGPAPPRRPQPVKEPEQAKREKPSSQDALIKQLDTLRTRN